MYMRIYIAGKYEHKKYFAALALSPHENCSSWVFNSDLDDGDPDECKIGWIGNHKDIKRCDVLFLIKRSADEILKGALVEAGMAIALNKPVIAIGPHNYGTWTEHPDVYKARTIGMALQYLSTFDSEDF